MTYISPINEEVLSRRRPKRSLQQWNPCLQNERLIGDHMIAPGALVVVAVSGGPILRCCLLTRDAASRLSWPSNSWSRTRPYDPWRRNQTTRRVYICGCLATANGILPYGRQRLSAGPGPSAARSTMPRRRPARATASCARRGPRHARRRCGGPPRRRSGRNAVAPSVARRSPEGGRDAARCARETGLTLQCRMKIENDVDMAISILIQFSLPRLSVPLTHNPAASIERYLPEYAQAARAWVPSNRSSATRKPHSSRSNCPDLIEYFNPHIIAAASRSADTAESCRREHAFVLAALDQACRHGGMNHAWRAWMSLGRPLGADADPTLQRAASPAAHAQGVAGDGTLGETCRGKREASIERVGRGAAHASRRLLRMVVAMPALGQSALHRDRWPPAAGPTSGAASGWAHSAWRWLDDRGDSYAACRPRKASRSIGKVQG